MKTRSIILLVVLLFTFALTLTSCLQHEHDWESATCEAPKTCKSCGATEGEALGHVEEDVAEQAATCTEAGHTAGKKCSVCDKVLEGVEEIPKLDHTYDGCEDTDCNVCEEPREAGEHTYDNACDADCNVCDEERTPADHEYDNACDADCNVCDEERTPADHEYDNACDADCNVCSAERTPADHDYVEKVILEPTCSATGTKKFTCSVCGDNYTEDVAINPNAHYDDNSDHLCDGCGNTVCGPDLHEAGEAVELEGSRVDSTCTVQGSYVSVVYCKHCGTEMSRETISLDLRQHNYNAVVTAPTCTNGGYTTYTCTYDDCQHSYVGDEKDALNHNYEYVWADDMSTCTAICQNDTSHTETATVSVVTLSVSGEEVTFNYKVEFVNSELAPQSKTINTGSVEIDGNVAKINAPAIAGRVASHDYIKVTTDVENYTFDIYYSEVDVWDGTSASTSLSGEGTEESPYLIQSAADLAYIANTVNAIDNSAADGKQAAAFSDQYFKMTKSIDLNGTDFYIGSASGYYTRQSFGGYLDGNNCIIKGLNNSLPFFACVENGWIKNLSVDGEIRQTINTAGVIGYLYNSTLHNVTNYADITGTNQVGGLAGNFQQGKGKTSTNLVNYGSVTGTGWQVGGIAGCLGYNLSDLANWGAVTANGDVNVGGIAGACHNDWAGTLTNVINYGTLSNNNKAAGHIVGAVGKHTLVNCTELHTMTHHAANEATCTATGNVEYWACSVCKKNYDSANGGNVIANVVTSITDHVWDDGVVNGKEITYTCKNGCGTTKVEAALTDFNYVWSEDNSSCTASAKYTADGTTLSETVAVSLVTLNVTATKVTYTYKVEFAEGSFEAQTKTVEGDVELVASIATINAPAITGRVASHDYVKFDFYNVESTYEFNIYYSELSAAWDGTSATGSLEELGGDGTENNPYIIDSAEDLALIANMTISTNATADAFGSTYFKMTKSIDLNEKPLYIGEGNGWANGFSGYFDGNNCSIRNMKNADSLFGAVKYGRIENLTVYGEVTATVSSVGAVVAYVHNSELHNITNYASVTGAGNLGGIVGNMEGKNSTNLVNYGSVTGSNNVGGIGGIFGNALSDSTNWGTVTGTTGTGIGGIVGSFNWDGSITNCTNYGAVTGTSASNGGIAGKVVDGKTAAITNCVNNGTVTGSGGGTAGIFGEGVGTGKVTIIGCTNNGDVVADGRWGVGGILGYSVNTADSVSNCINNGDVTAAGQAAGIVGKLTGNVTGCTNNGAINATVDIGGGIVGQLYTAANKESIEANNTNNGTITCPGSLHGDIIAQVS